MSNTVITNKKVGLVLGCGAVAGAAWSVPMLAELQTQLNWHAINADILIGTSAGAVLAALLAAGVSVDEMMASQRGELNHSRCQWDHAHSSGPWHPPLPKMQFSGLPLLQKGLRGEVAPLTALCGVLPQGQLDMAPFRQLVDAHVGQGQWANHPACWIMAVDSASGERMAFGRTGSPVTSLADAVCASYAVPGWCPPVDIHNRTYLDGGIASPVSADLLADTDVEVVIVLAPMASRQIEERPSLLARAERMARRYMTDIVEHEVTLLQRAGKTVIRLEPGPEDLRAFGYNMMDPRRRMQVFEAALKTATSTVQKALAEAGLASSP